MPATETHAPAPARSCAGERSPDAAHAFASRRALSRAEMIAAPVRWPRPSRLEAPLPASSARTAQGLEALGLRTVGELLEHLPSASRETRTVAALRAGEQATVAVQVRAISDARGAPPRDAPAGRGDRARRHRQHARDLLQPAVAASKRYSPGTRLLLHGKADAKGGFRVSHHAPSSDRAAAALGIGGDAVDDSASSAVAHYPAAEGVSSTQILTLVQGLSGALADMTEALSAGMRVAEGLPDRAGALAAMHFPHDHGDAEAAPCQAGIRGAPADAAHVPAPPRRRAGRAGGALALDAEPSLSARWLEGGLPFALTGDQRRAIEAIAGDLAQPQAMQRLLMGEVGSGKTVVALYAMLRAVRAWPPGGADGANRDARRAALRHASAADRLRAGDARSAHRLDARGAAARTRSASSGRASCR